MYLRTRNVSSALPALADQIMTGGEEVGSRGGTRTMEILYSNVTLLQPWQREVLTPGRKASLPAQVAETMWVLTGRDDVEWLSNYLPRAKDFSDDGKVWRGAYGPRLRSWGGIDQLHHVVELLRADPATRRAVIGIYNPAVDYKPGKDIPCNDFITFQNRLGKLHMGVTIRSNDLIWGWSGINAFEWSSLQEILAWIVGVEVGELHFHQSSLHVYDRHWDRARALATGPGAPTGLDDSPRYGMDGARSLVSFDIWSHEWFRVEEQIRLDGKWHAEAVDHFPEPMLRSWLRVIQYHWTKDAKYLAPLAGTRLYHAALLSPTGA